MIMNRLKSASARLATLALLACFSLPQAVAAQGNPGAIIHTSMGDIQLELYPEHS
jgi:hypothetical protein